MREEKFFKFIFLCGVVVAVAILLNITALNIVRRNYAPQTESAAAIYNLSGQFREWLIYLAKWKGLVQENEDLKGKINANVSAQAKIQSLQSENDSLRKTLGLATRLKEQVVPAGIFSISLSPDGYHALINKGSEDGISSGEAVVSLDGILVGQIKEVFPSSAQVILVEDVSFSVTVKVLNGQTKGILRGLLQDGMTLDLVTQSDQIVEGDTLITSGDDFIPAGLVVGTVKNVENNDTQLFKKIKVNSAMDLKYGSVVVIQR